MKESSMLSRDGFILIATLACATLAGTAAATQPPDIVQSDSGTNTAMGGNALAWLTTGYQNTGAGYGALQGVTSGYKNTAFGYVALASNGGGIDNAAFGSAALHLSTGSYNSAFGMDALYSLGADGTSYNTAVGSYAAYSSINGVANVAVGADSMYSNTTGESNTVVGYNAFYSSQTGSDNVAVGRDAMSSLDGIANTAVGDAALIGHTGYSGNYNVAVGYDVLPNLYSSSYNTGVGSQALWSDTTGSNNIALGYQAGYNVTTGSNNIEIGNMGSSGDASVIRLGTQNIQTKTFIAGVYGTSVSGNAVYVNSQGQLGVVVSSERFKTDIASMKDPDKLSQLRPVTFHLKTDPKGPRQYGLIAEEVAKVYPALVVRDEHGRIDGVRYDELAPILLRKVQLHDEQLRDLRAQASELSELQRQLADMRAFLAIQQQATQLATNR
jgi:Chaperone of endosialidase